ncbi:hypothetical protein RMN57_16160 [Kitasatospora sp. CM 4170]|uniref:AraC family transcriptional regulator n=1 Tax=Kitasatospora aburaviensis TaxID=67265 RepID=A0ABW1F4C1_9ACTN|nr:hypothetical protein [Kitasatospora sp. CM 4170]WNM46125.1 hypothetical protein RMN57_16160 [Kitasatospora sp. CM 4170]
MGELAAELTALFADGFLRRLHVARTRRRLAAGRPVRVPCSARSGRPGQPDGYVNGRLRITPGAARVDFDSRVLGHIELACGGTFHEPEPEAWHSQDWAATAYLPPGDEHPVHLQVDSRYLPLVRAALTDPRSVRKG